MLGKVGIDGLSGPGIRVQLLHPDVRRLDLALLRGGLLPLHLQALGVLPQLSVLPPLSVLLGLQLLKQRGEPGQRLRVGGSGYRRQPGIRIGHHPAGRARRGGRRGARLP